MELHCQICHRVTVLTDGDQHKIRTELSKLGPSGRHIWQCECGHFQIAIELRENVREERAA
jgi:hypothetical protein